MRAEDEEAGFVPHAGPEHGTWPPLMSGEDGGHVTIDLTNVAYEPAGGYPDGNPKTAMGAKKPDLTCIPATALLHLATGMMNGEIKYGLYNWRNIPISARPYIAAGLRHLLAYMDGEDYSADTVAAGKPVHHLAHVMATCAIILDAEEQGVLNDNRGTPGKAGQMIETYNATGNLRE